MDRRPYTNIDEFISGFSPEVQDILKKLRHTIHAAAPQAVEAISYGIPTFKLKGVNLVHFGAFKDHISFFPTSSPMSAFAAELAPYEVSKGTIRFPLDKPIPYALVEKITRFRVQQVLSK